MTEVTVTGRAGHGGNGAASNFSKQMIENAPTVDRNVYDVAKLSPLVNNNKFGGISIAGTNNRYNSFQIDGMVSNDVFGLTSSGTNGGQTGANPISMDAIEQIQVAVSPFDVRQSGFTGGVSMLLQSQVQINSQVQPSHTTLMKTFMAVIAKSTRKHKSFLMKAPKLTALPLVVLSLRTNCSSSLHWNIKRTAILQPIMLVHRAIS